MAERVASAPSAAWHNGLTPHKGPKNQIGPALPPTRLVALAASPFEACGFGLSELWASNVPEGATQVGACPGRMGSDALGPAPSSEVSRQGTGLCPLIFNVKMWHSAVGSIRGEAAMARGPQLDHTQNSAFSRNHASY